MTCGSLAKMIWREGSECGIGGSYEPNCSDIGPPACAVPGLQKGVLGQLLVDANLSCLPIEGVRVLIVLGATGEQEQTNPRGSAHPMPCHKE